MSLSMQWNIKNWREKKKIEIEQWLYNKQMLIYDEDKYDIW